MTVNYAPLESKSGFSSPGFSVNSTGILTSQSVTTDLISTDNLITNIVTANNVIVNGQSLSTPTSLPILEITGDFSVTEGSTAYLVINNGQIAITNRSDTVGSINNVNIGDITPAEGNFTNLTASTSLTLNVSNTGTINNVNIGATTAGTGRFTSVILTQEAVTDSQVPTKRYVDTRITALAIALGT